MDTVPPAGKKTRLFVAVHGIGDQFRYATPEEARSAALDKASYDQNYECAFRAASS